MSCNSKELIWLNSLTATTVEKRQWNPESAGPASLTMRPGTAPKQRGDKAKEEAKKFSKAKSAIKMAHKSMELMKNLDQATIDTAHQLIAELEAMIEAGTPPSETQVKKLDKLF